MTYYIRHKVTGLDTVIEEISIQDGTVLLRDHQNNEGEQQRLRLVDVIEDYEFRYDIW